MVGEEFCPKPFRLWWNHSGNAAHIGTAFLLHATTEERLTKTKPVEQVNLIEKRPQQPLHFLYSNPTLESELDSVSREAFGFGVFLDRYTGGSHWALRCGDLPANLAGRISKDDFESIRSLPLLHEQGDGVKSLAGLLLLWLTTAKNVALVDEPEAFLHPPQAAFLSRFLSEDTSSGRRLLLMATHSSDVVRGALDSQAAVSVVRVTRDGQSNHLARLSVDDVKRLWSDSLLRYSNLLEGLFSDAVVVCESDGDCRYYSAVLDGTRREGTETAQRHPDILWTHCHGKHRIHVAVAAMRALGVPVIAIADFDVLRERATLVRLLDAFGAVFDEEMEKGFNTLTSALASTSRAPSVAYVKESLDRYLANIGAVTFEPKNFEDVKQLLRTESGWDRVKKAGITAVPQGDPRAATDRLLDRLGKVGLFIVPVGAVEGFVPDVGGHGPGWVAEVLERNFHIAPRSVEARAFVRCVLGFLNQTRRSLT